MAVQHEPKTSVDSSHWNRPADRQRPKFHGMALARVYRNVAKKKKKKNPDEQIGCIHGGETSNNPEKDAFNSPFKAWRTKEVYKCAQSWVSALFFTFLRCFAPRELAKLVGLQNLFRDLGFFFLSSLKLFPLTSQRACTWKRESERESGRIGNVQERDPNSREKGVKVYQNT